MRAAHQAKAEPKKKRAVRPTIWIPISTCRVPLHDQGLDGPRTRVHEKKESGDMPKMKTHSGAKKRSRVTGSGKIMRRQAGKMHLNEHKPTSTRRLSGDVVLSAADVKTARKLLGK